MKESCCADAGCVCASSDSRKGRQGVDSSGDVELGWAGAEHGTSGGHVVGGRGGGERAQETGKMVKPAVVLGCMCYNFMVTE